MKLNRVSLNVVGLNRIGLNRIGSPSRGSSSGSDRSYIDPEVLASLKAVCICYGKSNDDPDRAVVKNLVDPDNPFVISNAAFKLNSGFGEYKEDFTSWIQTDGVIASSDKVQNSIIGRFLYFNTVNKKEDVPSFKVNITLGQQSKLQYNYIKEDGTTTYIVYSESGIYTIPASYFSKYTGVNAWFGFYQIEGTSIIEQIPSFEGAFVTDGIDDLIKSTKSATEMLDGSNEVTVVSMIHQIKTNSDVTRNNWFFTPVSYLENRVVENKTGKTGIYGYTSTNVTNAQISDITPILGDKNDYTLYSKIEDGDRDYFTVEGFQNQGIWYVSSIAWYWTIIANKVLTSDQINQVIAYFNLDRTLNPDILCNVKKQGITNENHAEFGDKLIDYSGNGRDIQLNNIAWKGDSGIGKYAADFTSWTTPKEVQKTSDTVKITTEYTEHWVAYLAPNNTFKSMKVLISGIPDGGSLQFFRTTADGGGIKMVNGINEIPEFTNTVAAGFYIDVPLGFDWSNLVIEQIPSHAGGLCLDGVNDYGKVTGLPIYKDYTVIADYIRTFAKENVQDAPILSKSKEGGDGAFIFNYVDYSTSKTLAYSFANINNVSYINDFERNIYYQSKYTNNGNSINAGTGVDTNSMWLGTYRDNVQNYFTGAIYSLMSFPYSMSEFLIERQLKKHKLGTLYPDMVEFRPIVKSNLPYSSISYSVNPGEYISVDSMVTITVTLPNTSDKLMEVSCNAISDISISGDNGVYEITGKIVKSPQKINLVISSYLTMLNNETLISNETLL